MKDWKRVRLEDCTTIVSGATPSTANPAYWGGEICWATPKDLSELDGFYLDSTPRKLTEAGLAACSAEILPVGSVLFSSRAPIGHTAINRVPTATNQGFKSFIPRPELLDATYLLFWLRANRPYLESLGNGATFKEVSKAIVSRIELPLPPLTEQRRIAAILDKAEALRAKRRKMQARFESLVSAAFMSQFGLPSEWHPKNIVSLESVCRQITDGTHKTPTYVDTGVPFATVTNIVSGTLDLSRTKFIGKQEHEILSKRARPEYGDILVSKDGTIGVPCPVLTKEEFSIFVSLALLKVKSDVIDPMFLSAQLNLDWVQRQIKAGIKGIAIRHLHLEDFRRLQILLPPMAKQKLFVSHLQQWATVKQHASSEARTLDSLFSSLQHRAFRGEL